VLNLGLPKGFSRVAIALFRPGSQMANTLSNSIALCVLAAHLILELLARGYATSASLMSCRIFFR